MRIIANCQVISKICENTNSIVYRGRRNADNRLVILKVLNREYPTPEEISRFRREYEIVRSFDSNGLIKSYSLEKYGNTLMIVFEDFRGKSLDLISMDERLKLHEVLDIGIKIVEGLKEIHDANVIHKDINPSNIVFYPETGELKIIDFGIASLATLENPVVKSPRVLEGTLAYVSPEQTGRMNRSIDYRTDFYSLGATLYELLTGKPPFVTIDPMELLHCHIAGQPLPLCQVDTGIPTVVSDIVLKLLAKTPEERYQSAWGIWVDLEECWNQLFATRKITHFPLARSDVHSRFQVSKRLYGREQEIETLLAAFERVSHGKTEMVFVSGYSGIGKSALVFELGKAVSQRDAHFISGKFDQFQQSIPYRAIVEAFRELVGLLLTESESRLNRWREMISTALGPNGRLITDVIPEVEHIVGAQRPVDDLSSTDAQNRFNLVFQNFVRVFSKPEHPLVLFLDDMQWADEASLRLLELLIDSPASQYLLLIGAYRDNEIYAEHPLSMALQKLKSGEGDLTNLCLQPLDLPHIKDFLVDSLKCSPERALPLAETLLAKTNGNAFFIIEFLKSLHADKFLEFVPPPVLFENQNQYSGSWQWSTEKIQQLAITENVAELIAGKIRKLEGDTRRTLTLAACIGNQFDLETLAMVCEKTPPETTRTLRTATAEGMVLPVGDAYHFIESDSVQAADWKTVEYKFSHDRIQQAFYSLIPENERTTTHYRVGRKLLENITGDEKGRKIFDIVNQLNLGMGMMTRREELEELVELNLIAGRKAKDTAAYRQAYNHLKLGIDLMGPGGWQDRYDLTLALHVGAVEAAYLSTDTAKTEGLAQVVLRNAGELLDKIKVYEIRIQACIGQNRLLEAVDIALEGLDLLGFRFPKKPKKLHLLIGLLRSELSLFCKRTDLLIDLAPMSNPHMLATMSLLSVASGAFFGVPKLYPLLIFKMVELSIRYGNASFSPFAYATYASILCDVIGDINSGRQFGELALKLVEDFNTKEHKAKTIFVMNAMVKHRHARLQDTLGALLEAYRVGLETGDFEFGCLAAYVYCFHSFYTGRHLGDLESEMASYSQTMAQVKQETVYNLNEMCRHVVLELMGSNEHTSDPTEHVHNETKVPQLHLKPKDKTTLFISYYFKLMLCYLFNDPAAALENASMAEKHLDGVISTYAIPQFHFYSSLAGLGTLSDSERSARRFGIMRRVSARQKKLKKWARNSPMNHMHKFYLVEAERNRVLGRNAKAMDCYDRALQLARANECIAEEALTNYLAAKFYLTKGKIYLARAHMIDARYAYTKWGAMAKVRDIDVSYGQLLARTGMSSSSGIQKEETTVQATSICSSDDMDLTSALKASQAISDEIVLSKLLAKLMHIVIENAGARKGFLILKDDSELRVEARASLEANGQASSLPVPLERCNDLSQAIVHYVSRTKTGVVLSDATMDSLFGLDRYVKTVLPKSILGLPIMRHGNLTGILYLENDLIPGAFTPERVRVLELISSQAAISIEHAKLYAELEDSHSRRKLLSKRLIDLLEMDRKRIAMELHDDIGQLLTTLKMDLEWISSHSSAADSSLGSRLENALGKAAQVIKGVREISYGLRPSILDNLGLLPSIQNLVNDLKRSTHIDIHFFSRNIPKKLDPGVETTIYRVLQEALSNVIKHSQARQVHISFVRRDGLLSLSVEDDGIGFEPAPTSGSASGKNSMGLLIMRERIVQANGEFSIESRVGGGTLILAEIPL